MSKTVLVAIAFTVGLSAGVFLSLRLKPRETDASGALDLRVRSGETVRVRSVVDGDTIVLENGLHLRYSGINAPESGRFIKSPAPLASEATARNRELVEGRDVRIELGREPLDIHGRAIGRVFVKAADGTSEVEAGEQLVREGLAKAMNLGLDSGVWERLQSAQDAAKESGAGIWKASTPPESADAREIVSSTASSVYHAVSCAQAQRIKAENRRFHASVTDAAAAGLRACELCQKNPISNHNGTEK